MNYIVLKAYLHALTILNTNNNKFIIFRNYLLFICKKASFSNMIAWLIYDIIVRMPD